MRLEEDEVGRIMEEATWGGVKRQEDTGSWWLIVLLQVVEPG